MLVVFNGVNNFPKVSLLQRKQSSNCNFLRKQDVLGGGILLQATLKRQRVKVIQPLQLQYQLDSHSIGRFSIAKAAAASSVRVKAPNHR